MCVDSLPRPVAPPQGDEEGMMKTTAVAVLAAQEEQEGLSDTTADMQPMEVDVEATRIEPDISKSSNEKVEVAEGDEAKTGVAVDVSPSPTSEPAIEVQLNSDAPVPATGEEHDAIKRSCEEKDKEPIQDTSPKRLKMEVQNANVFTATMLCKPQAGILPQRINVALDPVENPDLWRIKQPMTIALETAPKQTTELDKHVEHPPLNLRLTEELGSGKCWTAYKTIETNCDHQAVKYETKSGSTASAHSESSKPNLVLRFSWCGNNTRARSSYVEVFAREAAIYRKLNEMYPGSAVEYYGLWRARVNDNYFFISLQEYVGEEICEEYANRSCRYEWSHRTIDASVGIEEKERIATLMVRLWTIGIIHRGVKSTHFRWSTKDPKTLLLLDFGDSQPAKTWLKWLSDEICIDPSLGTEIEFVQRWLGYSNQKWKEILDSVIGPDDTPLERVGDDTTWVLEAITHAREQVSAMK